MKKIFLSLFVILFILSGCSLKKTQPTMVLDDTSEQAEDIRIKEKTDDSQNAVTDTEPEFIERDADMDETPLDVDEDGISDRRELELGTDPNKTDSDGDGLDDSRELELGTDLLNRDTDDDGYEDGEEVAGGYDPLMPPPDPTLAEFVYFSDGSYFRQNAKGSLNDKLFTLWEPEEPVHLKAEYMPEWSNRLLVMDYGVYEQKDFNPTTVAQNGLQPEHVYLIDVRTKAVDEITQMTAPANQYVTYLLTADGSKVIRLADVTWPIMNIDDMDLTGSVEISYYDITTRLWRTIGTEDKIVQCDNTLVHNPYDPEGNWRLFNNLNWTYTRMKEGNALLDCDLHTGIKTELVSYTNLCPESSVTYLMPSVYNPNYYIFACSVRDVNIYNLISGEATKIAEFRGQQERIAGLKEGGRYLLSPKQQYFLYSYQLIKQDGEMETVQAKNNYLMNISSTDLSIMPGINYYRPYSYDGEYVVYTNTEEGVEEGMMEEAWISYAVTESRAYPLFTHMYKTDEVGYDVFGRGPFVGWINK